jgi:hypothetical protein
LKPCLRWLFLPAWLTAVAARDGETGQGFDLFTTWLCNGTHFPLMFVTNPYVCVGSFI